MNPTDDPLAQWLGLARADLARRSPPAWIEAALAARQEERMLLRRLRPGPPPAPRHTSRSLLLWLGLPAGIATLLVFGFALVFLAATPSAADSAAPAFVALTPLETIAAEPRPVVIASEVPRAQLAAYGLPVDPARADQPVRAEFLVSQRGAVLAVRFSPE